MYALSARRRRRSTALQQLFGSTAADTPGSYNLAGIKDPAVDALIDEARRGPDREEHRSPITRSIDRVLRASHYWIPNWNRPTHWVAIWDMFGWPEKKPDYAFALETTWWFDRDKARAIGKAG